jgi:NADH-quinone oxidoreductase subunit J
MGTAAFVLIAAVAVGSALGLVLRRNPIHGALFLVVNLGSIAALFLTLGAEFLAAAQVIVYAGAIMVLVVFVIMLLNVEEEERRKPLRLRLLVPAAVVMAAVLFAESAFILYFVHDAPDARARPTRWSASWGWPARSAGRRRTDA